jgi:formylglycine-generating enzyme required for sulfatase activity
VFTRALLPALVRPGLDLPGLALEVRKEVTRLAGSVNHAQRPAYYDETSGDRIFLAGLGSDRPGGVAQSPAGPGPAVAAVAPPVKPAVPAGDPCSGPMAVSFASTCAAPLTTAQERGLKSKDSFRECENCPEMVVVPAGSFMMGSPASEYDRDKSEGPQHVVMIAKPFAVGKFHVTVNQYAAFVQTMRYQASSNCYLGTGLSGSWRDPGFAQEGSHPVVCVSWDDAKAYVDWLAQTTGKSYRLLSEAEWEYAARGRTSPGAYPRFWFGDNEKDLCRYSNFAGQESGANPCNDDRSGFSCAVWTANKPCNDGYDRTSPAGNYQPNAFGLYDMAGNAWQWTADCYHDSYNGAPADGSAWTAGQCSSGRVVRGGSWYHIPWFLRAGSRRDGGSGPNNEDGFRVARTLVP